MSISSHSLATASKADEILKEYGIVDGMYLLGSVSRGLTIFDQQVRAHNLAWALWRDLEGDRPAEEQRIAVVGGGIAGLTVTACLLARSSRFHVTLFEERWDLCPLQQGSDTRWVHPHIYRWPEKGSRVPDAGLPVLNWTEGRASDVSREVLEGFGRYADRFGTDRLDLYLGLNHLRIDAANRKIEWMGRKGERRGAYVRAGDPAGARLQFTAIVIATGFGLEEGGEEALGTNSYWRNDRLGQPQLGGGRASYLISGFGDGALVDLCRLTIERFRQDTILYELFCSDLEGLEDELQILLGKDFGRTKKNVYDILDGNLSDKSKALIDVAICRLLGRLRKDTIVVLHARGKNDYNYSIRDLFNANSSFLNRMMLYLLYRCGGFVLSLGELEDAQREFALPRANVVKRYGADTLKAVAALFSEPSLALDRLKVMKQERLQSAERQWPLGAFPHLIELA